MLRQLNKSGFRLMYGYELHIVRDTGISTCGVHILNEFRGRLSLLEAKSQLSMNIVPKFLRRTRNRHTYKNIHLMHK